MSSTNTSPADSKTLFITQLKKFIVDNTIVGAISGIALGLFLQI